MKLNLNNLIISKSLLLCICFIIALLIALGIYLTVFLKFDALVSDVAGYWIDSLDWKHPYDLYHVPAFSLLIALLRGLTFNLLPPLFMMRLITFSAVLTSLISIFTLIKRSTKNERWAIAGTLLFILWPFVGLTYAVYPVADLVAIAFFLVGILLLSKNNLLSGALFLGLTLISHKALWPVVGLVVLFWILRNWQARSTKWLIAALILILPLGIIWMGSAIYHRSLLGMVDSYLSERSSAFSPGNFLFASILGVFQERTLIDFAKSSLSILIFISTLSLIIIDLVKRNQNSHFGLAILVSIILLYALFNFEFIFYIIRFSRLLVLPAVWNLYPKFPNIFRKKTVLVISGLILIGLVITQFIMVGYLPVFFS